MPQRTDRSRAPKWRDARLLPESDAPIVDPDWDDPGSPDDLLRALRWEGVRIDAVLPEDA